jgi:hypothetical protein
MDNDAAAAIDARLNGLSAAICALVAAMVARGDMEKGVVIGTLAAYRDAATKSNAVRRHRAYCRRTSGP